VIYYYLIFSGKSSLEYYLYTTKKKREKNKWQKKKERKDIFKIDIYLYNQDKFAAFRPSSIIAIKRWASVDSGTSFS